MIFLLKYIINILLKCYLNYLLSFINILSKFIAAQESFIDSESAVWIYNKSIDKWKMVYR